MNPAAEVERFVELFNAGEYWEAHEALEDLWRATPPPGRDLYQGLIQAAAAMVHWQRSNLHGMRVLHGKSKSKLLRFRPDGAGLDIAGLIWELEHCLLRGGPAPVLRPAADPSSRPDSPP